MSDFPESSNMTECYRQRSIARKEFRDKWIHEYNLRLNQTERAVVVVKGEQCECKCKEEEEEEEDEVSFWGMIFFLSFLLA